MTRKIGILQPEVPHYRTEFFQRLADNCELMDLYVYNSLEKTRKQGFNVNEKSLSPTLPHGEGARNSNGGVRYLANRNVHEVLFYNPLPLLNKRYDTLVLMLHFAHVTTWLLLLTKWLHRKKIVVWGQGISVKRYLQEEKKPSRWLRWQIALSDGAWIYMEKEAEMWRHIFPQKPIVALNNSLTNVSMMLDYRPTVSKEVLRNKYGIGEETVFIYCARFENNYRRVDLLVEAIERLDSQKYGFIIIGEGKNKPDFTKYKNVHDFGAVYDNEIKRELFAAADIYFQPGWVGLSIVEAMAYGKPVFTFKRSEETLQCVEYDYIKDGWNGLIFDDMNAFNAKVNKLSKEEIERMGGNANHFVRENLTIDKMVQNALSIL